MSKIEYGECVNCEYCDTDNKKSWCKNPKGGHYGDTHYHIADTYCEQWKPCEEYKRELDEAEARKKPSYGNGYIDNPWNEWLKKAYKKGMIHE